MPGELDYFIKDEASVNLESGSVGNYFGGGVKYAAKSGTYEGMLAFKANESSHGMFGEFKYTSPKVSDFSLESRTRTQFESSGNTLTTRVAGKYSKSFGKFSIYEIAGATTKFSLDGGGTQSITPVSLTGAGYNITPKLNCYVEGEISKGYDLKSNCWNKTSPAMYLGVKYTF